MSISRPVNAALAAVGLAGLLVVSLSACTPEPQPEPSSTATPRASTAPIFASDEEALAAAVKAYEAFAEVSDAITHDGGADSSRVSTVVTEDYLAAAEEDFAAFRKLGLSTTGTTRYEQAELMKRSEASGVAEISIYLCQDPSEVRVLDADGTDVTPSDRPVLIPSQATFVSSEDDPTELLVDGIEKWRGQDFCQ